LLNDCKYGYDIKDNVIRLTLLRSPIEPDPQADQGRHIFTYSLLPHEGDWRQGDVARQAYSLNVPLLAGKIAGAQQGSLPVDFELASLDAGNVMIETVKRAEGERAWVIRLYEYQQCHSQDLRLRFGHPIRKAMESNLVEEDEQPVAYAGDTIQFSIAPYEIKTFKVWL
jgi:alpha-mannosidase